MSELVGLDRIDDAARTLGGVVIRTPLLSAPWLSDSVGAEVRLKCENLQRAGSFKLRGAYTMISRLSAEERRAGVITYSSGNHAQAVALAAQMFRVPAVVVMPTTAPRVKVHGARTLGAEVVFEGTTSIERRMRAERIAAARGLAIVPPFDHPDIIAGQATVGLEILQDWPEVMDVLVPIGGGGLASGVAAAVRGRSPTARVIGVEPVAADAMRRSLSAGEPVTIAATATVADGLAPVRPGDLTFAHARALLEEVVTVEDAVILEATKRLVTDSRMLVEPSGAATTAALLSRSVKPRGNTVAVISGGNLDMALLERLLGPLQEDAALSTL